METCIVVTHALTIPGQMYNVMESPTKFYIVLEFISGINGVYYTLQMRLRERGI